MQYFINTPSCSSIKELLAVKLDIPNYTYNATTGHTCTTQQLGQITPNTMDYIARGPRPKNDKLGLLPTYD